jgi:hypothetical protein
MRCGSPSVNYRSGRIAVGQALSGACKPAYTHDCKHRAQRAETTRSCVPLTHCGASSVDGRSRVGGLAENDQVRYDLWRTSSDLQIIAGLWNHKNHRPLRVNP